MPDAQPRHQYGYIQDEEGKVVRVKYYPVTSVQAIEDIGDALNAYKDMIVMPEVDERVNALFRQVTDEEIDALFDN